MIEHMFDHGQVTPDVTALATRLKEMQRTVAREPVRLTPALEDVVPGGLVAGSTYAVEESTSLALSLLASASSDGQWAAVVGIPDLGVEAAAALGIDLSRTVLVPTPGDEWPMVVATLVEVLPLIVLRPSSGVQAGQVARLSGRLRHRGAVLVVLLRRGEQWPRAAARLAVDATTWQGLDAGMGHLRHRCLTVTARARDGRAQTSSLWFADGALQRTPPAVHAAGLRLATSRPDSRAS
jgi:hypothetical protein